MKNNLLKEDIIYLLLTKNIKDNLNNETVDTIFIDCTYKIIPPGLRGYKFLVIVGYDNIKDKLNLYLFGLIKHENKENFESVLNYLKINYNFSPKNITSDFHMGQVKAILSVYNESNLILCWFHALRNIKNKIPFLNSKNSSDKIISRNIIANLKLMFFIPEEDIEDFYRNIKRHYNNNAYTNFYKYMDKFINKKINGKKYLWNYSKLIRDSNINETKYFVTNNFVERTNKTLKENLLYTKSSFINFRNTVLLTDIYFENKNGYKMSNPNLSKSLIYYIQKCNYRDKYKKVKLIDLEILKNIYATYVKFIKDNGLEMFDKIENEDFIVEEIPNDIEDDENSDSNSDEEDESKNCDEINIDKKDDPDDDNDNSSDDNFIGKKENKIIYPKQGNNHKSKNKKNEKKGKSKNKNKNNSSNNVVFNSKFNFNLKKLMLKRTYNDMITEQKKNFINTDVETKLINFERKKKDFINYGENMINYNKELYDTYLKLNCLNLK